MPYVDGKWSWENNPWVERSERAKKEALGIQAEQKKEQPSVPVVQRQSVATDSKKDLERDGNEIRKSLYLARLTEARLKDEKKKKKQERRGFFGHGDR